MRIAVEYETVMTLDPSQSLLTVVILSRAQGMMAKRNINSIISKIRGSKYLLPMELEVVAGLQCKVFRH